MTKRERFYTCGEGKKPEPLHYTACGLDNVWLVNGYECEEHDGEKYVSVQNVDGLWKAIGISLAIEQTQLSPKEIRFLRRHMQLTQDELAKKLGVDTQTVARWEKEQTQIPGPADLAIRTLFLTSPRAEPEGAEIITKLYKFIEERAANAGDRRSMFNLELIQTHDHWQAKLMENNKQFALL